MAENKLMKVNEVATALGVKPRSVYLLIKRKKLRALRIERLFRVRQSDLLEYIEEQMRRWMHE